MATTNKNLPVLVAALAAALLIGFLAPRPTFVNDLLGQQRESDFLGTPISTADVSATTSLGRVQVDLYGESLCPDTVHFIVDVLKPMFDNGLSKLVDLRYFAYGNVKGNPADKGGIACQHGTKECLYNRHLNCAQVEANEDQVKWFPYVFCMAKEFHNLEKAAETCAENAGLSAESIASCASGQQGAELEIKAADATNSLVPKHSFVPWVVVNGLALGADFENLDRYVCLATEDDQR